MQPSVQDDKPPYVTFETRAVEDRAASTEAGHYVAKDVDFAMITPIGSKDRIERIVVEWFDHLAQQVREGRFKPNWLEAYRSSYAAWKEGREIPLHGTAILSWPLLSPAQIQQLISLRVRTVEDLAAANEETLQRIGMGSRSLKQRAIDWLASSKDSGQLVSRLNDMQAAIEDLKVRNASLEEQLDAAKAAAVPAGATPKG